MQRTREEPKIDTRAFPASTERLRSFVKPLRTPQLSPPDRLGGKSHRVGLEAGAVGQDSHGDCALYDLQLDVCPKALPWRVLLVAGFRCAAAIG